MNETQSFKYQPSKEITRDFHWFPPPLNFKVTALKVCIFIHQGIMHTHTENSDCCSWCSEWPKNWLWFREYSMFWRLSWQAGIRFYMSGDEDISTDMWGLYVFLPVGLSHIIRLSHWERSTSATETPYLHREDYMVHKWSIAIYWIQHDRLLRPAFLPVNYLEFLTFYSWDWRRYGATVIACH